MRIIFLAVMSVVAGCATPLEDRSLRGGVSWNYEKIQDGCRVSVTSASETRELAGSSISIDDCNVTFNAESLSGQSPEETISGFIKLLSLIRGGDIARALQVLDE